MSVPVGTIIAFYGVADYAPMNYLFCEGQTITFGEHPKLWKLLRNSGNTDLFKADPTRPYGADNMLPALEVRVPDLRGDFLRGIYVANPDTRPPKVPTDLPENRARRLGSYQAHAFQTHHHTMYGNENSGVDDGGNSNYATVVSRSAVTGDAGGAAETRPRNIGVAFLIRSGSDADDHAFLTSVPVEVSDSDLEAANAELRRQGHPVTLHRE